MPDPPGFIMGTVGPMARSAADLSLIFDLLGDAEADDLPFFDSYDVLLVPPALIPAFEHDQDGLALTRTILVNGEEVPYLSLDAWASIAGLSNLPATTAPVSLSASGLPVGVQIIGPTGEDETPLAFAEALDGLTGGFRAPPSP